jgi:transcriptional regulator with XRE-family HTH domain
VSSPEIAFSAPAIAGSIGELLRYWRAARRISQLDLSLEAGVSTRHVSYIETGRAQPSREMVLRLATALQVPLRERNMMLLASGYAALYQENHLEAPELQEARRAIEFILAQQEPYPAFVVDRHWNILMTNRGTERFFALFPQGALSGRRNAIRMVLHPNGLRPYIANWEDLAARLIQRVHREVASNPSDTRMIAFRDELLAYPGVPDRWRLPNPDGPPVAYFTIDYSWQDQLLRVFSAITTFGTPQDLTLQELRIESFFPADEFTRTFLNEIDRPPLAP